MNHGAGLTIEEILKNKNFCDSKVVAGKNGLQRTVKWIHIMEVTGIDELLNGGELILSTGIGWKGNDDLFISFFNQLIKSGAAGICIELGTYIPTIPEKIKQLANEHNFPLIVFYNKVRFIDITQDLHTLIIKKHYEMISDLEEYSNQLNQLLLTSNSHQKILKLIHNHLKISVILKPIQGEMKFLPRKLKENKQILQQISSEEINNHKNIAHQSIQALNRKLADLYIISKSNSVTEYEKLILDRTATALAQNTLRDLYYEELRKTKETEWIQKWLDGVHSHDQIYRYLNGTTSSHKMNGGLIILLKIDQTDENNVDITHLKILFRSVFLSQGFSLYATIRKNFLVFILVNNRKSRDVKSRILVGIDHLRKAMETEPQLVVGRFVNNLGDIKESLLTAEETISILERNPHDLDCHFYEDLYIYRLISVVNEKGHLEDFINDYLGPVIKYDRDHNGKLMETLRTYLKCNGSKKETASNLFIVRQTLYQRLQKISELLGEDFMSSYKRQAIEFAITAYDYLSSYKINI